ncbi:MAG: GGDEF domain-containing protein [gamma proteobacterium symbiont of Bathyaustriella thionipta]|nr:GGDEF domain-containing protein [gamma proteobacterium symbiont of Bathyaustriella thionipta]
MANKLQDIVPKNSLLARFGDYSYAMIYRHADNQDDAESLAIGSEIAKSIATELFEIEKRSITTTISLGICECSRLGGDAIGMLSRAERTCMNASEQGGNKALLYSPSKQVSDDSSSNMEWMVDLIAEQVEKNSLHMLFQPAVSLKNEPGEYYQLLPRLLTEDGGQISAGEFIPVARSAGLLGQVDASVLRHAIVLLAEKHADGQDVRLFVSQSAEELKNMQFLGSLKEALNAGDFDNKCLIMEFDTDEILDNLKAIRPGVEKLKELGVSIGFAGFQNSDNHLRMLQHINADYLKLHHDCLDLDNNKLKQLFTEAHKHHMQIVAPRIENPQRIAALWSAGADFIQGNFIQKPDENLGFDFADSVLW